jgi:23S rRNA pseudouridine1911/1915/1917 synthase
MVGNGRRTSRNIRSASGAYVVVDTAGGEHVRKTPPSKRNKREPVVAPADICSVMYCDDDVVAACKAPGFPVVPTGQYHRRSVQMALAELGFSGLFPVNLLDREASGLVLFSRTEAAAKSLRWNWRSDACERQFIAVVEGGITGARGRISLPIGVPRGKGKGRQRRQVVPVDQGGRSANTKWKLLARGHGKSRLLVTLNAGRSHQIRIHLAAIGHPVVNERTYIVRTTEMPLNAMVEGSERNEEVRDLPNYQIGLHCLRIRIPHPSSNEPMDFKAPVPRALLDLMPGAWVVDAA